MILAMTEGAQSDIFLHGVLDVAILDASNDGLSSTPLLCMFMKNKPAYVTINLGQSKVAETTHEYERVWNQKFEILCAHPLDIIITLNLKTSMSVLGKLQIPAKMLVGNATSPIIDEQSFPLVNSKGKIRKNLKLRFLLSFRRAEYDSNWCGGFKGFNGIVGGVSFPPRSNCDIVLYQDAHHGYTSVQTPVGRGLLRQRRLWEDVYKAINGAKHLVCIAGWSLNPKLVLVRDPNSDLQDAVGVTIGDLLKRKANEGVSVRVMLWDDETSVPILRNKGMMRTHDEDSLQFFRHSKVLCRLCPRLHHELPTFFAHHQKTITVDAHSSLPSHRTLVSFIGGLDLCDGRYDTEEHSLFRTLNDPAHVDDFYQTNIASASLRQGGPREPWHDTHARVVGEAASDILANFEQRWKKQCNASSSDWTVAIPNLVTNHINDGGNWDVQVFRSVDHVSVDGLPYVEHSVHDAYVNAIRRSQRFIYIENQYFMGGCELWDTDRNSGCRNLIPVEIALKVASKIRARERFAVYVVMPMWPEGVPESEAVQEMLHWTRQTVVMMYRLVGEAVREFGGGNVHPREYLNFFCLANREERRSGEVVPPELPRRSTHYWCSQVNRRFMIYVHSKLMIVDDEYLLIGSANINQRSMDGRRDTEIAIGCHQPAYVGDRRLQGDIHAYRISLWNEHTGLVLDEFDTPESISCVSRLREIAHDMWKAYAGEEVVDMEGVHLVSCPLHVDGDGRVGDVDLDGRGGVFPDTSARISGRRSMFIPPVCTT